VLLLEFIYEVVLMSMRKVLIEKLENDKYNVYMVHGNKNTKSIMYRGITKAKVKREIGNLI